MMDSNDPTTEFLTPAQMEKHPHFVQLLKDLCTTKLGSDFCTKSLDDERNKALKEYSKAKSEHDVLKLIVDCIWEIIFYSGVDDEIKKKLEDSFLTSEFHHCMKIQKDDSFHHVFGLEVQPTDLDNDTRYEIHDLLRKKLIDKGVELLQSLGTDVDGNPDLLMAKLNQLPNLINRKLEEKNETEKTLEEKKKSIKELRSKYMITLLDSLRILEELIQKHLIQLQCEQYQVNGQWIKIQCDALLLKIKALHLEILCETYNKDTSPALHCISKQLATNIERTEADIEASKARLHRYESVGQDFNQLVTEYTQLRETIKQKKWTLEKLKTYCN